MSDQQTITTQRFTVTRAVGPQPGESAAEAQKRQRQNRAERQRWQAEASQICGRCGYVRLNVVHEEDPVTAPEGPEYYADMLDELHPFEPPQ